MNITKRQPISDAEMTEKFLVPMALTQGQLAETMGVSRKNINELCINHGRHGLMLATIFVKTADFWLNLQQRNDRWGRFRSDLSVPPGRKLGVPQGLHRQGGIPVPVLGL